MANSVTEICNMALTRLGVSRITDFDTDQGIVAEGCRENYPAMRDAVLRAYYWNCATRRAALAAADPPAWGYAHAYNLPSGAGPTDPQPWCLRVVEIEGERCDRWGRRYKIEGRQIVTDAGAPLNILYIGRVVDVSQYDAMLTDCIAQRLAAVLAFDRTGSEQTSRAKWEVYAGMIREARAVDAQEGMPEAFGPDPNELPQGWLESRR